MDNVREIVTSVACIWRMHRKRESLFKAAMLQADQRMRRICTAGYMNALLFQKDVESVYNTYKYSLDDGQLGSIVQNEHDILVNNHNLPLAMIIKENQQHIICRYQELLPRFEANSDATGLFENHIGKLSDINILLDFQLRHCAGGLFKKLNAVA